LFAEHGYDAVSVRHITEAADTRLASVNYHFKSKEKLFCEVIERRAGELSELRLQALLAISDEIEPEQRILRIVESFINPLLEKNQSGGEGWKNYCRLIAQVAMARQQSNSVQMLSDSFDPTAQEFVAALRSALPGNDDRLAHYAFQFMLGATLYIFTENGRLTKLSDGKYNSSDLTELSENLIAFVTSGINKIGFERN